MIRSLLTSVLASLVLVVAVSGVPGQSVKAPVASVKAPAATVKAPATVKTPQPPNTSSVFYRTKGTAEWHLFGIYSTEDSGRSVFRHLASGGYEVELRISNVQVPPTPPRPSSGLLPVTETVTLQKARDAFDWISRQPDIAFRFPVDGCYARTHLMCQRLIKNGFKPRKVWSFANGETLYAKTKNHPSGYVTWGYHVAPLLRVRFENNTQRWYVLDPSIFQEPVPVAQWEAAQMKSKEGHKPYLTLTRMGQPPTLLSGKKAGGTGYWPASDPKEGPDTHAVATMKKYKPY